MAETGKAKKPRPHGIATGRDALRQRLMELEDHYLETMDSSATIRWAQREWKCSPRTAGRYMRAVLKSHQILDERERKHRLALHRGALKRRIRKAEGESQWGAVSSMSALLAKLEGLSDDRVRVEHAGTVTARVDLSRLSDADLDELDRIERLALGAADVDVPGTAKAETHADDAPAHE
jgi:hypothetical protein